MKNKNTNGKSLKYKTPIKKTNKSLRIGLALMLIVILLLTFKSQIFPKSKKQKLKNEALQIIERAKTLTQYIPNTFNDSTLIREALENMIVINSDKNGQMNIPNYAKFTLAIIPPEKIADNENVELSNDILMKFHADALEKFGKIVVMLNEDVDNLTSDMDAKATCLIHELVHGLQLSRHFNEKLKITPAIIYADEKAAWNSQVYLYHMVRPDIFEGVTCDCQNLKLYTSNKIQEKVLNNYDGDNMVKSLVLFALCQDNFLSRMYNK